MTTAEEATDTTNNCACGTEIPDVRTGCDDCERSARLKWHNARPMPLLPAHWWRTYEPEYDCGPAYLYGRSDVEGDAGPMHAPGRKKSEVEMVYACSRGVEVRGLWSLDHISGSEARDVARVLGVAASDHEAMEAFEGHDGVWDERPEGFVEAVAQAASVARTQKSPSKP